MRYIIPVLLLACDGAVQIDPAADFEAVRSGSARIDCASVEGEWVSWDVPTGSVWTVMRCGYDEQCTDAPYRFEGGALSVFCLPGDDEYRVRYLAPIGIAFGPDSN